MNDPEQKISSAEVQRIGLDRLMTLAAEANPSEVTARGQERLFEEWEKAGVTIDKARQMLRDAIVFQHQCAEKIVRKLGMGKFRYKDRLYVTAAKGQTVYLRPLEKKAKP